MRGYDYHSMAAPRLLLGVVLHILIDKSIMLLLEAVPPTTTDFDRIFVENIFDAVEAET
ncbi:hypothetical protein Q671_12685 [Halomonas sp. PBN3]|nr:hypothetical protein Q671_12685 [Halomonas sp. PBN3]